VLRIANDALRFRPRDGSFVSTRSADDTDARAERTIERLTGELELTPGQVARLREEIAAIAAESRSGAPPSGMTSAPMFNPNAFRQKLMMRISQSLVPTMSDEQRRIFERWKLGRESSRLAVLWVLGADGKPERRSARTGLADDQFTEVLSGDIAEGDKLIVRMREATK